MSLDVYLDTKKCPTCGNSERVFSQDTTHNHRSMAGEAGICEVVWHPNENGVSVARELIEPLRKAILMMKADPERFKKHNAANGWGSYEHFLPWLEKYLAACEEHPDAEVTTWG